MALSNKQHTLAMSEEAMIMLLGFTATSMAQFATSPEVAASLGIFALEYFKKAKDWPLKDQQQVHKELIIIITDMVSVV